MMEILGHGASNVPMFHNPNTKASFLSTLIYLLQSSPIRDVLSKQPDGKLIKEGEQHNDLNQKANGRYFYLALQMFVKDVKLPDKIGEKLTKLPIEMSNVVILLNKGIGLGNLYDNQDIHEHLMSLINYIHEGLSYPIRGNIKGVMKTETDRHHLLYSKHHGTFYRNEYSEIVKHMYFTLESVIRCYECDVKSLTFSPENILSLPINKDNLTLEGSLNIFLRPEFMYGENYWTCYRCNKKCNASKQHTFWNINKTLMFAIKRHRFTGYRPYFDMSYIKIPDKLDMCPYMNIHSHQPNTKYKLVAMSCTRPFNIGYEAYTVYKNSDDEWVQYHPEKGVQPITDDIYKEVIHIQYEQITDEEFDSSKNVKMSLVKKCVI